MTGSVPTVLIVHCVDTEGPLNETIADTFQRMRNIFGIDMEATEGNLRAIQAGTSVLVDPQDLQELQRVFAPALLDYNRDWDEIDRMLERLYSSDFRDRYTDDYGTSWKFTWFCLDHVNYRANPRSKATGFGAVHDHYSAWLAAHPEFGDEIQWHFHPKSVSGEPLAAATSYSNSLPEILESLSRRIIDRNFFPSAYRPGFHSERSDANLFLEQWIPFDFGNQSFDDEVRERDMLGGRFGDWRRAPRTWRGYHPEIHDYQSEGACRRWIFRCLNVGTRLRLLGADHVDEVFTEAQQHGAAILAVADHDFRDIEKDVVRVLDLVSKTRVRFRDVAVRFCSADQAAQILVGSYPTELSLDCSVTGNVLTVRERIGRVFGSQPFLAIKTKSGRYLHDNLDLGGRAGSWTYTFDEQTIQLSEVAAVGVGSAGSIGSSTTWVHEFSGS